MPGEIGGIIAAVHTPMGPHAAIDLDRVPAVVERLIRQEVDGLFVCGTTGEWASLRLEERKAVAAAYVRAVRGRARVIVHVGHNCLPQGQDLADHAHRIGADAISAVAPSYFKPGDPQTLVACCAEISAAAPQTPFYYYHMPQRTGLEIPLLEFLRAAEGRLASLAGAKFTGPDVGDYRASLEFAGRRYNILFGWDHDQLTGLTCGGRGTVSTCATVALPLYRRLWRAYADGQLAQAQGCQEHAAALVEVMSRYGLLEASKAMTAWVGCDCGPCRLPVSTLPPTAAAALRGELEGIGFFRWAQPQP